MLSHVTVGTADVERATRFYDAVLATLGIARAKTFKVGAGYAPEGFRGIEPPFWVLRPQNRQPPTVGNGCMVAFEAPTRAAVDAFHAALLAHGGSDEGAPGLRPHFHANFYGAYGRDPEGNKLCCVCHRPE
ncbi:VOC family protein [Rhodoplanes sp. TEM]|uniref:VOC family protein n=1 Tax=Rhodoplanes tepidamans TaxID=200616 RepID=A0ABT5J3J0_RHOTP|nr:MULTISPECIES: VOC family protein [Rhodoplanes]MDC7784228.1 VOC family protein [Rhodoplanes tepidamans]MDC7988011.1 VOC family protein [Rhodoplanes sp. TEM]MDQ0356674.1 catechol 2,3-dioxygenase-like lactoylglutathione lyase family enzyme [Rhodoplanes tepidamans]